MEISRMMVELLFLTFSVVGSVTRPWWRLMWFSLCLYISAWTTVFAWGLRLLQVPSQVLTAPARERKIASEFAQLQAQYEGLRIRNRELERSHKIALNEHRQIQQNLQAAVISEVNKATHRSKLLKLRIRELEERNFSLEEVQRRKRLTHDLHPPEKDVEIDSHSKVPVFDTSPTSQPKPDTTCAIKPVPQAVTHAYPATIRIDVGEKNCMLIDHRSRGIACVSSLFSATLSALVAVIAWHAKDPCWPLIIALFTVVGMSCVNVVRFVSKGCHRFGLDAIVLVGFNSFVLGTLAAPFLPYFAPRIMHIWWWSLGWVGLEPEIGDRSHLRDIFPSALVPE